MKKIDDNSTVSFCSDNGLVILATLHFYCTYHFFYKGVLFGQNTLVSSDLTLLLVSSIVTF